MVSKSQSPMNIIGLMSGTSVDSIDAALCELTLSSEGRIGARLLEFHEHPMSPKLRERIFQLFRDGENSLSLACSLNFEIGEAFASAALGVMEKAGVSIEQVHAIASHGQTAYHIPPHMAGENAAHVPSTLQIGEAAIIAERTGIPVVADFRVADMAAGGNGAPLVPFADFHLFSRPGEAIVLHNIGGIANLTLLPASGKMDEIVAFDTGPGNMIIDALVDYFYPGHSFDVDGRFARNGRILPELLAEWMAIPYVTAKPPKTTGREMFGVQFAKGIIAANPDARPDDLIASATAFTAESLARNLGLHVLPSHRVTELLLAGGGAMNNYLFELITTSVHAQPGGGDVQVRLLEETGFSSKSRECVAFAVLGYAHLLGMPANVPSATGARYPALLGKLVHPPQRKSR